MQKVAIIGATGMLGSMVYNIFKESFSLVLLYKIEENFTKLEKAYGQGKNIKKVQFSLDEIYGDFKKGFSNSATSKSIKKLQAKIGEVDAVINCAGIIKPYVKDNEETTFFLNSAFPHLLASIYKEKLIHITTDCVFNGIEGAPYDENFLQSPNDLYGLSKSLGEPSKESFVLRTSIIGPEIHGFLSFLEWIKTQKRIVKGYKNHLWNGITTKEFAKICKKIISDRDSYPKNGLYHVFSTEISKYEMICKIKEKYHLDIDVESVSADIAIDRRLSTVKSLNRQLEIPSFDGMLNEL